MTDSSSPWTLRNAPVRPREWSALVATPGAFHVQDEGGELLLAPDDRGQMRLHWAYSGIEVMRNLFAKQFDQVRKHITADRTDYAVMDLIAFVNRDWVDPLLRETNFDLFAEWMDMAHPALDTVPVPEIPEGVTIRRSTPADTERLRAIWTDAYGEYGDGPRSFDPMLAEATWAGVLERQGEIIGFALNGAITRGEGRILCVAMDPEHQGHGGGKLLLSAALYQLASKDATSAVIRVRPDIKHALRICSSLGMRHQRSGVEYRRSIDADERAAERAANRTAGVRARMGRWR
ncbi:MAG: GNAT family N-acetyltransferase [Chloroflexota bacterium]